MDIYTLREYVWQDRVRLTAHARQEMGAARLSEGEIRESILSGDLFSTESDQTGTKYRVQGTTFYTHRVVEAICAVEVDEETEQAQLVIVTVYERKPKRRGGAKRR
jgi:hypothetical protein